MTVPISHGTTLKIGSNTIGRIISIGELSQVTDIEDITTYDSPNKFKEKLATLKDAGDLPVVIEYDATATTGEAVVLQGKFNAQETEVITITVDDGTITGSKYQANGFVSKLGTQWGAAGAKIIQNITLTLSGAVTHAAKS
ncbi:MAG: hypothetical protein LLF76_03005 [Planctomycetaceae bacterium]|nr:hypothetical protein [Planctomycetaceae bacterium]